MDPKYEKKRALRWFKKELHHLHKTAIKEISVSNNTISSDMIEELEHFLNFGKEMFEFLKDR